MNTLQYIYERRSVRKFKEQAPANEDLKKILEAATYAPSGRNLQNWHFVVVTDREKIQKMAEAVEYKNEKLISKMHSAEKKMGFQNSLSYSTFFRNAPVCILVMTEDYPITALDFMIEAEMDFQEIENLKKSAPGIQGVSAAIENLQLAAATLGYGTCWMTGPNYAAKEILEAISFEKEGYYLVALMPLGIPDDIERPRTRKSLQEVVTFLEE